ncbi:MAG: hypothetical protein ACXVEF_32410 [Polyangiales bacterium]
MARTVPRWVSILLPVGIAVAPFACGGKVLDEGAAHDAGADAPTTTPTTTTTATTPPSSTCPSAPPVDGTSCGRGLSCTYPCVSGSQTRADCFTGTWHVVTIADACDGGPPPPPGGMVGRACMTSDDCDATGSGIDLCTTASLLGPLSPIPTCIETECSPSTTDAPAFCGGGENGICLRSTSGSGLCVGACHFDTSGGPPTGCLGKDACHPYAWRIGPSGAMEGFGTCVGGCKVDADCPTGSGCQFDAGYCVKKVTLYPKKQDEACKPNEVAPPEWSCPCLYDAKLGVGYCARVCTVGVDPCDPGHLCDAMLPPSFPVAAKGLTGSCLKTCTTSTECPTGTVCLQSGGTTAKTCQPAARP